jgi:3-hydroxyacyl-[acyl-carrier-protein] dehydratase
MPGVLIIEALAQTAGILSFKTMGTASSQDSVYFFVGIDNCRFKRPVVPGDVLTLQVSIERQSRLLWKYHGTATVGDQVAAEADLMCALRDIPSASQA